MNRGTAIMIVLAAVALGGAIAMVPSEVPQTAFEDTGTPLFPNFSDPALATSLEVSAWDEDTASAV